jgi:hypothetical protein
LCSMTLPTIGNIRSAMALGTRRPARQPDAQR